MTRRERCAACRRLLCLGGKAQQPHAGGLQVGCSWCGCKPGAAARLTAPAAQEPLEAVHGRSDDEYVDSYLIARYVVAPGACFSPQYWWRTLSPAEACRHWGDAFAGGKPRTLLATGWLPRWLAARQCCVAECCRLLSQPDETLNPKPCCSFGAAASYHDVALLL